MENRRWRTSHTSKAPLGSGSKHMYLSIATERNADVRHTLPGPVWYVVMASGDLRTTTSRQACARSQKNTDLQPKYGAACGGPDWGRRMHGYLPAWSGEGYGWSRSPMTAVRLLGIEILEACWRETQAGCIFTSLHSFSWDQRGWIRSPVVR
jgi:hypothetical protein